MLEASATDGMAKMIITATTSIAHANNGIRASVIPGARVLRMVATSTTAAASAETSVNVIICAQMSARLPGENCGPDKGVYANQPMSGAMFRANAPHNSMPPNRYM